MDIWTKFAPSKAPPSPPTKSARPTNTACALHQITIDFGATLQPSDLISNSTDYNFSLTATTSGLSATTSGLYLGDKIIVKENLGGRNTRAKGTVNAINTTTGAITVPSSGTVPTPSGNGYSPNATVFKWQREYFDITGAATTTRDAITNLTIRPTNGAGGRTVWLDDFRYNTNYLTASSSSAITSRQQSLSAIPRIIFLQLGQLRFAVFVGLQYSLYGAGQRFPSHYRNFRRRISDVLISQNDNF